jgi:hypothetical protein
MILARREGQPRWDAGTAARGRFLPLHCAAPARSALLVSSSRLLRPRRRWLGMNGEIGERAVKRKERERWRGRRRDDDDARIWVVLSSSDQMPRLIKKLILFFGRAHPDFFLWFFCQFLDKIGGNRRKSAGFQTLGVLFGGRTGQNGEWLSED